MIRQTTLNGLHRVQSQLLEDARSCQDICNEERKGKAFTEARVKLAEEIADALDAFLCWLSLSPPSPQLV